MSNVNIKNLFILKILLFVMLFWASIFIGQMPAYATGETYTASKSSDGSIVITGSDGAFNVKDLNNQAYNPNFTAQSDGTYQSKSTYTIGVGINSIQKTNTLSLEVVDANTVKVTATCQPSGSNCLGNPDTNASLSLSGVTLQEVQNAVTNTDGEPTDDAIKQSCLATGGIFGWIFCGILDIFDAIYSFFRGVVEDILLIDESNFDTSQKAGGNLYKSWANVRNIANGLIALSALVIIASQIFGFEILSAYTVKKALPRVLIAVIGIQLSWIIFTSLIMLTNAVGIGLYDLLIWPFVQAGGSNDISALVSGSQTSQEFGLLTVTAVIAGGAAIAASSSWLALALSLLGAIVGILIAFVVLIIRSVIIVLLLALAPLAIAAWVIPGTQTWWKVWWETFSKLLLMFPLIMALFAAGTIGANLVYNVGGTDQNKMLNAVIMIIVYFAPFFLVGATFKFAGNLFGKVVGLGDRLKGDANKAGLFGLRDRAKFNKENSAWGQIQANRKENLSRRTQVRNAERVSGVGKYGKDKGFRRFTSDFVQSGSAGWRDTPEGEKDLKRSQARAAGVIRQSTEEEYKNLNALAEFRVHQAALDLKSKLETKGVGNIDLFNLEQLVRDASLRGVTDINTGINPANGQRDFELRDMSGRLVDISLSNAVPVLEDSLKNDVVLQALQNKDSSDGLKQYIANNSNFQKLKDRGTEDRTAWGILAEKLPTAAKGANSASLANMDVRGFGDAVKNFAGLGKHQQQELISALRDGLWDNDDAVRARAAGFMQDVVRGPKIDQSHLQSIAEGLAPGSLPTATALRAQYIEQLSAARSATASTESQRRGEFRAKP